MIAMEKQTNTGKLLVAMLAMILVAVGAAVVLSDNVQAAGANTDSSTEEMSATEFLNLANDNGVITLQNDVVLNESVNLKESLTIVLNGYTLSSTDSVKNMFYNEGANSSAGVPEVDLTIDGEKAESAINTDQRIVFFRAANCDLTITGGQYTAGDYAFIWYSVSGSTTTTVNVTDAEVEGQTSAFWLSNGPIANATFTNCDITTRLPTATSPPPARILRLKSRLDRFLSTDATSLPQITKSLPKPEAAALATAYLRLSSTALTAVLPEPRRSKSTSPTPRSPTLLRVPKPSS